MCVIAIKPKNIKIEKRTVFDMFETNPHGAGMAIVLKDKTLVTKGYMEPDHFWDDVNQVQELPLVLHFRWATHGQVIPEMTHPFIVDENQNISTQLYSETDQPVVVHNGILNGYGNKEISDTCDFVTKVLSKLETTKDMQKVLDLLWSKFTLIHKGKIVPIGDFKKYRGLKVSNTDFVAFNYTKDKNYETNIRTGKIGYSFSDWDDQYSILAGDSSSTKTRK